MRNKKAESFNSWPFITSKHTWYSKMQCTSWFPIHSGEFSNFQIQNISKWCRATLRATEVNTVLMSSGSFPHLVLIRAHLQLFEMIDLAKPRFFQISAPHFFPLRFLNTWPCTIANSLRFPPFLWIGLQEGWEGKSSSALLPYRLMYRKSEIKKKKKHMFCPRSWAYMYKRISVFQLYFNSVPYCRIHNNSNVRCTARKSYSRLYKM
jgi:hypothetical protein